MKTKREKIKMILRREMKKIYKIKDLPKATSFSFCFSQAKFDTLMDIDRELKLGVFYKLKD